MFLIFDSEDRNGLQFKDVIINSPLFCAFVFTLEMVWIFMSVYLTKE